MKCVTDCALAQADLGIFSGRICLEDPSAHAFLSLRKHAYSNILKILPPKNDNFSIKNSDIFHVSAQNIDCGYSLEPPRAQNIDCGYSLEPPRRGGSNEYPQSMF